MTGVHTVTFGGYARVGSLSARSPNEYSFERWNHNSYISRQVGLPLRAFVPSALAPSTQRARARAHLMEINNSFCVSFSFVRFFGSPLIARAFAFAHSIRFHGRRLARSRSLAAPHSALSLSQIVRIRAMKEYKHTNTTSAQTTRCTKQNPLSFVLIVWI